MEERKRRIIWKVLDILVCIAFGYCNFMMILTSYCNTYLILLPICFCVFLWVCGGHPYRPQLSGLSKHFYTVLRCILYFGAVFFTLLPYTMRWNAAWYYPVQRATYLSCYTTYEFLDDFMPDKIPSDAEEYQFQFIPKMLQGSSMLEVSYFTNRETIAEFKGTAEAYGAKPLSLTMPDGMTEESFDSDGDSSKRSEDERLILNWRDYLRENYGQNPDGMELYHFSSGNTGHTYGIYILSEETGFFLLYR